MQIVRNIMLSGLLALVSSVLWLGPFVSSANGENYFYGGSGNQDYSIQYCFSSGNTPLGGNTAILNGGSGSGSSAQLTSGPFFVAYFLEKVLSYSYLREKVLSRASLKPFSPYFVHVSDTPGRYFVYVLREIII